MTGNQNLRVMGVVTNDLLKIFQVGTRDIWWRLLNIDFGSDEQGV